MKILLVEDNHDIRETLRENLESELFTVDCASNGEDGSYLARTNYYDLIVMDYMMPGRSGLQVCKEIREANRNAPIIMISVCDKVPEKVALLEAGADGDLAVRIDRKRKFPVTSLLRVFGVANDADMKALNKKKKLKKRMGWPFFYKEKYFFKENHFPPAPVRCETLVRERRPAVYFSRYKQ